MSDCSNYLLRTPLYDDKIILSSHFLIFILEVFMKKIMKPIALIAILAMTMFCFTACGDDDATWGDKYQTLIESGEARDAENYDEMKAELDSIREEIGATYVYAMSPSKDGEPSLDGDVTSEGSFVITIDGSEEPDDWGVDYGWEVQFEEAWNGEAAAARSAWEDSDDGMDLCWSAFAPVYNSDGEVVCILGIDYPANEVVDYRAWDRDSDEWNKFEDEITGEIPAVIEDLIEKVTDYAEEYAAKLSGEEVEE